MSITSVLSSHKGIALDTAPTVQGNTGDCDKRRLQSTEVAGQFQCAGTFTCLQRTFGRIGWSLYSLDNGTVVASNALRGLLSVCPDNRAASALLRTLGG